MTDERENKLPRWAKTELGALRDKVRYLQDRLDERDITGPWLYTHGLGDQKPVAIAGAYDHVEATVPITGWDDHVHHIAFRPHQDRNGFCLAMHTTSGGRLLVEPQASNAILLRPERL